MERLKMTFPANRVATIVAVVSGLVVAAPAVAEAFAGVPKISETILALAGLGASLVAVIKFLSGAQKWEQLSRVPVGYDPFDYDDVDEDLGSDEAPVGEYTFNIAPSGPTTNDGQEEQALEFGGPR